MFKHSFYLSSIFTFKTQTEIYNSSKKISSDDTAFDKIYFGQMPDPAISVRTQPGRCGPLGSQALPLIRWRWGAAPGSCGQRALFPAGARTTCGLLPGGVLAALLPLSSSGEEGESCFHRCDGEVSEAGRTPASREGTQGKRDA